MIDLSTREVFEKGHTCYHFSDKQVTASLLEEIYDEMKLGPTSANCCPLRIFFVISKDAKERLYPCLMGANIEKAKTAPVVALFADDMKFYEKLPELFPHNPNFGKMFENNEELTKETAFRNSTLQTAYFMARSFGLDCGPMSGFNSEKLNREFFSDTNYKVNFICNLGYKAEEAEFRRGPKLDFDTACKFI